MGRKERRAMERRERKESIRMTPDRIQALKQKTANEAVRRVQEIEKGKEKQRESERLAKISDLIPVMKQTAELAGFEVVGRIILRDKGTGKEYR